MRGLAAPIVALSLLACAPHAVPLASEQRADAAASLRIGGFELAPPEGRWVAESVGAGRALDAAGPHFQALLVGFAAAEGDGLRLCKMSRVSWETAGGGATEPREPCAWLQPFALTPVEPPPASARELVDRLAPRARAIEVDFVAEPDFWRGVKWLDGRGEAASLRVGPNALVDLHLVARNDPGHVLRAGGRVLLLLGPGGAHLALVVADASLVDPETELWRVLASLRPAAP
jgi:hypothetical protein